MSLIFKKKLPNTRLPGRSPFHSCHENKYNTETATINNQSSPPQSTPSHSPLSLIYRRIISLKHVDVNHSGSGAVFDLWWSGTEPPLLRFLATERISFSLKPLSVSSSHVPPLEQAKPPVILYKHGPHAVLNITALRHVIYATLNKVSPLDLSRFNRVLRRVRLSRPTRRNTGVLPSAIRYSFMSGRRELVPLGWSLREQLDGAPRRLFMISHLSPGTKGDPERRLQ